MELKRIVELTQNMLELFVDSIGLDGETYAFTMNNCPIIFGKVKDDSCGQYISPADSKIIKSRLRCASIDNEERKLINELGVIVIDREKTVKASEKEFLVTMIHERIHANRDLLIQDAVLRKYEDKERTDNAVRNEFAYIYRNGKIDKVTRKRSFSYADASQEILKGSIDTSIETAKQYKKMNSYEQIEELDDDMNETIGRQMALQQYVDEALVELMSRLSYNLSLRKRNGEDIDIWKEMEQVQKECIEEGFPDVAVASQLIIKHKDFELFHWMLDPIGFSNGDIHYDFFSKYTEKDEDLVERIYELGEERARGEYEDIGTNDFDEI